MFRALTVDMAARYLKSGRNYLRTSNGGRPHRQIHFEMPVEEAREWRRQVIAVLKRESRLSGNVVTLRSVSRTASHKIC